MTGPPRALISSMLLMFLSYIASRGTTKSGEIGRNQGDGPVLHFAGGIAFGVDVGDFLELQGALEGDGVIELAAHEQTVAGACVFPRDCQNARVAGKDHPELAGNGLQFMDELTALGQ